MIWVAGVAGVWAIRGWARDRQRLCDDVVVWELRRRRLRLEGRLGVMMGVERFAGWVSAWPDRQGVGVSM